MLSADALKPPFPPSSFFSQKIKYPKPPSFKKLSIRFQKRSSKL